MCSSELHPIVSPWSSRLALQSRRRRTAAAPGTAPAVALAADRATDAERAQAGGEAGPAGTDVNARNTRADSGPDAMTGYPAPDTRRKLDRKSSVSCPLCGAPLDVRPAVSGSGWMRQPMIPSMTRLSCGTIRCQVNGTYVPVAEFELAAGDWMYFSPKVLLWAGPATTLTIPRPSRGRSPDMMEAHGPDLTVRTRPGPPLTSSSASEA
jgi:hypothetical protein